MIGSWVQLRGPVIQANGRLTFEDDLRSGGLLMLHYTVNQHPHWARQQYGHSGGTRGWLGVERCQLCLQDTSRSAKRHRRAAVGHWFSLCVKCSVVGWLIVYQDGDYLQLIGQYSQTICRSQIMMIPPSGREH
jgi:hypothetical protein